MVTVRPVNLPHALRVSDEQFVQFVQANPDLRLERTATGELISMAPAGSESGHYNAELNLDIGIWNRQQRIGILFDSSSGFRLPNGAIRSPDVAWIEQSRWQALTPEQRKGFAPICPDFVIELASETDQVQTLQLKMQEYVENGCLLGWLLLPRTQTVEIYRPNQPTEHVSFAVPLSGELVLPGLVVDLQTIFTDP
jgi:Uma2 family endonuclease